MNLTVDVISDVICPWCYIGKRRLEKAIVAADGQHDVKVHRHPFQLNPTMPKERISRREYPLGLLVYKTDREEIMNLNPILKAILEDYALSLGGYHGVAHWARVLENGLRLAEETGANVEVVSLFAVLHDSRRINEVTDPEHGLRAAEFAAELRGTAFDLDDHEFRLLYRACEGHTDERNHPDVTIQTCWDSDRLDLGGVRITPHPSRLCTEVAKRPEVIKWADGRASFGVIPMFVMDEWGIDLEKHGVW